MARYLATDTLEDLQAWIDMGLVRLALKNEITKGLREKYYAHDETKTWQQIYESGNATRGTTDCEDPANVDW
jgi:hypothetical protein